MSRYFSGGILTLAGCALLCTALLGQPRLAAQGFESGVQLCLHSVLPALFPYFVVCELLSSLSLRGWPIRLLARLLGLQSEQTASALLLAWAGGYAVCARMAARLRQAGTITSQDATLLLLLGCCSGPGFVIGCVGGLLLGNLRLGILLYAAQLAVNLLCAALCLPLLPHSTPPRSQPAAAQPGPVLLPSALSSAVDSSLQVCGCVIFFRTVATLLAPYLPKAPLATACMSALLEISAGCADFSALGGRTALYGCCVCLSLLGLSVWMQLALLLQGTVSLRPLVVSRLLHLVLFPPLVGLCARFLPGCAAVYRSLTGPVIPIGRLAPDAAVVVFLFLCAALYKIRQNFYNG